MKSKPGPLFRDWFFGAPYKLGGKSKGEGFDCVSFVESYSKELGNKIPDFSDLYAMYDNKPEEALKVMWKRLFEATSKVSLGKIVSGDIVVLKVEGEDLYPSIYMGNNKVAFVELDKGVVVHDLGIFELVDVRRLERKNG